MTNIMKFLLTLFLFLAAAASLVSADEPLIPFQDSITISPQDIGDIGVLVKAASSSGSSGVTNAVPNDPPKLPVSQECLTALLSIVVTPEFLECMPVTAFAPLIKLMDPKFVAELLKDPVTNAPPLFGPVFNGWCPAPKCSEKGVAAALKTVQDGCKADAGKPLIQMITTFIVFLPPIKDSACFHNEAKDYCLFETLQKVFTLPPPAFPVTKKPLIDSVILSNPVTICTGCNKAIVNSFLNYLKTNSVALDYFLKMFNFGQSGMALVHLGVSTKCGQQFDDGKVGDPTKGGGLCSTGPGPNSTLRPSGSDSTPSVTGSIPPPGPPTYPPLLPHPSLPSNPPFVTGSIPPPGPPTYPPLLPHVPLPSNSGHPPDPTLPPYPEQQLSLPQDFPIGSGATSIKGISLLIMMGSFLVSTFFMI